MYRDFGQCTGENWSPVQGFDSNRLAGMHCKVLKHFRKVFRRVKILSMLEVSFYLISFHSYFSLSVKIIADESTFFLCMLGLHPTPTNTFEMSNS